MDSTLVQIVNEWIATQALLRQAQQENAALKDQIAELQKPKVAVSSEAKAPLDNPSPSGDSA